MFFNSDSSLNGPRARKAGAGASGYFLIVPSPPDHTPTSWGGRVHIVGINLGEFFNPMALAICFMDDGIRRERRNSYKWIIFLIYFFLMKFITC